MSARVVYPLRPGRPRVYQTRWGSWAMECQCVGYGRRACTWTSRPNCDSWRDAMWHAMDHLRYDHLDPLERQFLLPAYERTDHA